MRGNWNDVWASPIILSMSEDSRRKVKKGEEANDLADDGPGLFGDEGGGTLAAE